MAVFEETFVSPFEKESREDAFRILEEIRKAHPAESGWKEISAWVEKLPNGKWRAVRHHKKVS